MERLCDVLEVRRGVTAVIGGGGKTSLLYRLASELRERGMVLVATTTRILPPAHLPVRHDREGTLRALRANGIAWRRDARRGRQARGAVLCGLDDPRGLYARGSGRLEGVARSRRTRRTSR